MKKNLLLTIGFALSFNAFSQTTTIDLTGPVSCKDVFVDSNRPTENLGDKSEISAYTWTSGGVVTSRSFLKFSLNDIPANAIIDEAKLYLYHHPSPVYAYSGGQTGANSLYLQLVTSSWDELSTNWGNQPSVTSTGQISVAASTSSTQDYVIDVLSMMDDLMTTNMGISIRLQNETPYASASWASTEYGDATQRPRLSITYHMPVVGGTTITFGSDVCKDVFVDSNRPTEDLSAKTEIDAYAWTSGGAVTARTYIRFDMSTLPANAIINEAKLYLYHQPSPVYANSGGQVGQNDLYVSRVTSSWTDVSTNWNNQPSVTTTNRVSVGASTSSTQDYVIPVTNLVNDMITNNNYGFSIALQDETPYKSTSFASSEYGTPSMAPKLEVTYTMATGIVEKQATQPAISMYPNPATDHLTISIPEEKTFTVNIYNVTGQLLYTEKSTALSRINNGYVLNTSSFRGTGSPQLFLLEVKTSSTVYSSQFMCK